MIWWSLVKDIVFLKFTLTKIPRINLLNGSLSFFAPYIVSGPIKICNGFYNVFLIILVSISPLGFLCFFLFFFLFFFTPFFAQKHLYCKLKTPFLSFSRHFIFLTLVIPFLVSPLFLWVRQKLLEPFLLTWSWSLVPLS